MTEKKFDFQWIPGPKWSWSLAPKVPCPSCNNGIMQSSGIGGWECNLCKITVREIRFQFPPIDGKRLFELYGDGPDHIP